MTTSITRSLARRFSALILGGAVLAAFGALPAQADPSLVLKYDQQSLSSEAGARALYQRILSAANDVCPASTPGSFAISPGVAHCRKEAIACAVSQVHNPRLAELAGGRSARG